MSSKQKMMEQSYNLFCEHGENFSLSQVTDVLGIKKQSIYNYFSGKDELIIEMLTSKIETYYDDSIVAFNKLNDASLKDRLYGMGKFTISEFDDEKRLRFRKWVSMSMSTKGIVEVKEIVKSHEAKFRSIINEIVQYGIEEGIIKVDDVEFIVTAYIVLIRGIVDGILSIENYDYSQEFYKRMYEHFWIMITSKR